MLEHLLFQTWLFLLLAASGSAPPSPTITTQPGRNLPRSSTLSNDTNWQKYVRAPSSRTIIPQRVLPGSVSGNVSNPDGLVTGDGLTILTRWSEDEDPPALVVDFGDNLVGLLGIQFNGASSLSAGPVGLRLAFSETVEYGYLTNVSDFSRSNNAASFEVREICTPCHLPS